jgi:hypothetical protein
MYRQTSGHILAAAIFALLIGRAAADPVPVLTQHYDDARTGSNLNETILTPKNVNVKTFGRLFTLAADANISGQPLYVPAITIQGKQRNVVFFETGNISAGDDNVSLYAYDADDPSGVLLWKLPLGDNVHWMTSTPVIDLQDSIIFCLTQAPNGPGVELHAIDMIAGVEKQGSPVVVAGTFPGTSKDSVDGVVSFNSNQQNARPGLLYTNGTVYFAFSHANDATPYHGWVFAYQYSNGQFKQTAVLDTTPSLEAGGVWMSGKGLASDDVGNIYCATGNGGNTTEKAGADYGWSYLKLNANTLAVEDFFTPYIWQSFGADDLDVGITGVTLIPGTNMMFGGATKYGTCYVLNTQNLGKVTPGGPDAVPQEIPNVCPVFQVGGVGSICWNAGANGTFIYFWPEQRSLLQWNFDMPSLTIKPASPVYEGAATSGGSLCVTSNGDVDGIVWAAGLTGILHAYDAMDVSKELWNSEDDKSRDALGGLAHFGYPLVVNGKVYVPTASASLAVYGLLPSSSVSPSADSYVRGGADADNNYGSQSVLEVGEGTSAIQGTLQRCTYIAFDLTDDTVVPTSALLQLNVLGNSTPAGGTAHISVYGLTDPWTESGITWNNAPDLKTSNGTSTAPLITTQSVPLTKGTITIDVTPFIQSSIGQVVTLQIMDNDYDGSTLYLGSSTNGSGKPMLLLK